MSSPIQATASASGIVATALLLPKRLPQTACGATGRIRLSIRIDVAQAFIILLKRQNGRSSCGTIRFTAVVLDIARTVPKTALKNIMIKTKQLIVLPPEKCKKAFWLFLSRRGQNGAKLAFLSTNSLIVAFSLVFHRNYAAQFAELNNSRLKL
jgi:hypothetical protein